MKHRFFQTATIILAAVGCTVVEPDGQPGKQFKQLTITATREDYGPETKTVRNEANGAVLWTPGDRISLFYGSGSNGGSEFVSNSESNSSVTNFTGTIGVITGGADVSVQDTYFWGLYPYDETASCDGTSITMTLTDHQVATPGTFATNTFPAIGRSPGLNMGFYNVCGGLKIRVQKEGIKKVTLHSNDGPIAGKARIVLDDSGIPSVAEIIDGSEDIILEAPVGEYLIPGENYYFVMYPHDFQEHYFTLTFETFTETGTYERKKAFTISRSFFEGFTVAIDGNVTYEAKTGSIPVEDPAFKAYLVSNFDTDNDNEISYEEALAVTKVDLTLNDSERVTLNGIECFSNLETLIVVSNNDSYTPNCFYFEDSPSKEEIEQDRENTILMFNYYGYGSLIGHLDLTSNKKLKALTIQGSYLLEGMDVSGCPVLEDLTCSSSMIAVSDVIDISHNPGIKTLNLEGCIFSGTLDLTDHPELKKLSCGTNAFSEIVFGDHPNLENLYIYLGNIPFESLSLAAFPELKNVILVGNAFGGGTDGRGYWAPGHLKSLDVTGNTKLEYLNCAGCNLEEPLDLTNCTLLKTLIAFYNEFEVLTLGNHPYLEKVYISGCWHLKELNLLGCPSLNWISTYTCYDLGPIDYSNCTALKTLKQPPIGSDLSHCNSVEDFDGSPVFLQYFPHLKSYSHWNFNDLDLSTNTELETLNIGTSNCTTVDLSPLANLRTLTIGGWSSFETMDISHNLALENVTFEACEALQILYVAEGQMIEGITVNRSDEKIHPNTQILIASTTGGNEGSGDHNENEP